MTRLFQARVLRRLGDEHRLSADLGLDALEGIALVTQHLPHRGQHTRHDFGYYSNAAHGQRKKLAAAD